MQSSLETQVGGSSCAVGGALLATADTARPATNRQLAEAVGGLRARTPEYSAAADFWPWQRQAFILALLALCAGLHLAWYRVGKPKP